MVAKAHLKGLSLSFFQGIYSPLMSLFHILSINFMIFNLPPGSKKKGGGDVEIHTNIRNRPTRKKISDEIRHSPVSIDSGPLYTLGIPSSLPSLGRSLKYGIKVKDKPKSTMYQNRSRIQFS